MKQQIKHCLTLLILLAAFSASGQTIKKWKSNELQNFIAQTDKPTVINFWATFCKPCLEELPYFQQMAKKYDSAGLQLVLVSLDMEEAYPAKIKSMAGRLKVTAPIYFLDETNADVFCPIVDKNWSGAIPASLFINNKKGYRKFFEDQLTEQQLEAEVQKLITP